MRVGLCPMPAGLRVRAQTIKSWANGSGTVIQPVIKYVGHVPSGKLDGKMRMGCARDKWRAESGIIVTSDPVCQHP